MVENGLVCVWRVIYVRYVISLPRKREMERREKRESYVNILFQDIIFYIRKINFFNSATKRSKRAEQQKGLLCRRVLS